MLGSKAPKDDGKKGSPKKGKPGKKGDAAADEQAEGEEAGVKDPSKPPIFVVLETFTVNLQNPTGDQFLQIDVTLQVRDSKFAEMIKAYMPEVRSRVLLLLSGKKASDINNVAGKQQLAREISAETAKAIGDETAIKSAFFTSFVIQ
jgi:flagellar FliL protein